MRLFGIDFFFIACGIFALIVLFVGFLLWRTLTGDPRRFR